MNIIAENVGSVCGGRSSKISPPRIGGAKLREILEFLISQELIEETAIKEDKVGRPKRVYSIIEKNISS